ncbi:MAG: hypothetical protein JWR10_3636 [Rubritepida sp.]|nr:hypothetical protein [Rubritepida sp.]
MTYQLAVDGSVLRLADGATIPDDPRNRDRFAYETWLADGGVPDPAPVVVPIPPAPLTARQLRLWLLSRSITGSQIITAIAALPGGEREHALIEWEYSTEYLRSHPLIEQIGTAFGLSPSDIDAAWPDAAAL